MLLWRWHVDISAINTPSLSFYRFRNKKQKYFPVKILFVSQCSMLNFFDVCIWGGVAQWLGRWSLAGGLSFIYAWSIVDDTYIIVPASCADTRCSEIDHVERWARENNLQLNRTKTREIIFTDKRRKQGVPELSTLLDVARVSSLKILGVTITNRLSASEHVRDVISTVPRLCMHCLCSEALQVVFRSVVVGRLLYASCAWCGFVTATDRKRVDVFLRRSKRSRFCSPDLASYDELLAEADTRLFSRISTSSLYMFCMIFCRHHQLPRIIKAFVNDRIISHYLTAPLALRIPISSPDASSTMLTNWLMINNYHNYMTYFFVFSYKTLLIDILHILSPSVHFSYVIIAAFCQLCLINI